MRKRSLGETGIAISEIGLGAWGIGGVYHEDVPDEDGAETVMAYIDVGGNHIDTASDDHKSEARLSGIAPWISFRICRRIWSRSSVPDTRRTMTVTIPPANLNTYPLQENILKESIRDSYVTGS